MLSIPEQAKPITSPRKIVILEGILLLRMSEIRQLDDYFCDSRIPH